MKWRGGDDTGAWNAAMGVGEGTAGAGVTSRLRTCGVVWVVAGWVAGWVAVWLSAGGDRESRVGWVPSGRHGDA